MMSSRASSLLGVLLLPGLLVACQTEGNTPALALEFVEAWGESGTEPGQFREPIGIAITDGEVFVSEAQNRRVQALDREGAPLRQIGPVLASGDTLRRPMHLATADSILYVPDFNTDRIHVLSLEGSHQRTPDGAGLEVPFDAPGGVAVDKEGRVYVADFYHHRVLRFGSDGTLDRQWGVTDSIGKAPDRFTYPTDVAVLPDGGFVVADAYNHRIKRYTAADTLGWMRPQNQNWADSTTGTFNVATAVTAGPDGHIVVADFYNHRIQIFSPDGSFLAAFGEQGTGEGQFERPVDLAFDEEGRLHVVDFGNDRIQVFRRAN
ncbi:MAG: hypothetical protein V5A22_09185 [Salinivenus sp.]